MDMLKRLNLIIVSVLSVAFVGSVTLAPVPAYAESAKDAVCSGLNANAGDTECKSDVSLSSIVSTLINIFSVIIGIVAVIMIIVAGFRYVTAGGDSGNITSAKNTLMYAIIGLVIAALSQAIVRFVLGNLK